MSTGNATATRASQANPAETNGHDPVTLAIREVIGGFDEAIKLLPGHELAWRGRFLRLRVALDREIGRRHLDEA